MTARLPHLNPDDPHEYVMQLALGHIAARTVHALAKFAVMDRIAAGSSTAADLAHATNTSEAAMLRLLRAASALRLVSEEDGQRFTLTPSGEALRSDAPRHAAAAVLAMGEAGVWRALGEFARSVETGEPLLERTGGAPIFSGAGAAAMATRTAEAMIAFYGGEPSAVADAYDFSAIRTVADIGGSSGNLLTTLLLRNAHLRGVLFDRPATEDAAKALVAARGVADRCEIVSGSFFESVPAGADAYIVSHVLHDWPEERCESILRMVRSAMTASSRLLVIEPIITSCHDSDPAKFLDVISLSITGGRHRTTEEFRALFERTGFRMTRVVATSAPVSIMEGEPA